MPKRAVIYARYSSAAQTEQSIEGQIYDCTNFANQQNIQIVGQYVDRAITGKSDDRPQFKQMISDSKNQMWDYVIVWKLDRFSRDTYHSAIYKHQLQQNGVKVLSAVENIVDSPEGKILEHILETMAEYYSEDLRIKTIRGMKQSALKANSTGGTIPLGYKIGADKKLEIDDTAKVIPQLAFQLYADSVSLAEIARTLNNKGYRTRNGKLFTKNSFYSMFSNSKYIGVYHYNGEIEIEGGCPQLIDEAIFQKVQEQLKANKKRGAKNQSKVDYLLSGKLFCGHCGEPMSGLSGKNRTGLKYCYYRCNGVKKKTCSKKNEPKDALEKEICLIAKATFNEYNVDDMANQIFKLYQGNVLPELNYETAKETLKSVETEIANIINAIAKTGGVQSLFDKLKELETQKEHLQCEISQSENILNNQISVDDIKKFINIISSTDIGSTEMMKTLIDIMISKVYVYDDKITLIFTDGNNTDIKLSDLSSISTDASISSQNVCLSTVLGSQYRHRQTSIFIISGCIAVAHKRL